MPTVYSAGVSGALDDFDVESVAGVAGRRPDGVARDAEFAVDAAVGVGDNDALVDDAAHPRRFHHAEQVRATLEFRRVVVSVYDGNLATQRHRVRLRAHRRIVWKKCVSQLGASRRQKNTQIGKERKDERKKCTYRRQIAFLLRVTE